MSSTVLSGWYYAAGLVSASHSSQLGEKEMMWPVKPPRCTGRMWTRVTRDEIAGKGRVRKCQAVETEREQGLNRGIVGEQVSVLWGRVEHPIYLGYVHVEAVGTGKPFMPENDRVPRSPGLDVRFSRKILEISGVSPIARKDYAFAAMHGYA
ncbi:hypothetical protein EV127DRAFT_404334 [Xylaria flabelliformis]|nr:hypothetical protein EV127DRAFT_404334 [Xylaria flabelliformis]